MLQALASLAQPIFNNGKLIANLKVSKAEEKIAQMNYQQTILEANGKQLRTVQDLESVMKAASQSPDQVLFMTGSSYGWMFLITCTAFFASSVGQYSSILISSS